MMYLLHPLHAPLLRLGRTVQWMLYTMVKKIASNQNPQLLHIRNIRKFEFQPPHHRLEIAYSGIMEALHKSHMSRVAGKTR